MSTAAPSRGCVSVVPPPDGSLIPASAASAAPSRVLILPSPATALQSQPPAPPSWSPPLWSPLSWFWRHSGLSSSTTTHRHPASTQHRSRAQPQARRKEEVRRMTWGFQTCGPNEAMVVSGESPCCQHPLGVADMLLYIYSRKCCRHVANVPCCQAAATASPSWCPEAAPSSGPACSTSRGEVTPYRGLALTVGG